MPIEQLALLAPASFEQQAVEWHPGESVIDIDRHARTVRTDRGTEVVYDALFLAQGGRARTLPGLRPHPRIATLRTHEDALAIKRLLATSAHVMVLGGGWIGLEVAASARGLGKQVTVLEGAPRLCIRTVPPCVSAHLEELHRGQGVDLRLGHAVQGVSATDAAVTVELAGGERASADMLVVGIGLAANDALAAEAGIECANGVLTDRWGRSSDPHVYAVGDVANAQRSDGTRLRIESWENAQRQAVAAAKAALGVAHEPETEGPPWFWSDQYDDNLQLLGLPAEGMRVIERRVPAKRQRVFFFCDGERVAAVAAVNAGREIKVARKWMLQGRFPALDALTDPVADLNKLPLASAEPAAAARL